MGGTKKGVDSLAIDISALAISGSNPSSERTKLDRDLFVKGFESGKKSVLVSCSVGPKEGEETMDSLPLDNWRSWVAGGSLDLLGVVGGVVFVEVVVVVVVIVVGSGGRGIVEVICLSLSSWSLALVVVAMVRVWWL